MKILLILPPEFSKEDDALLNDQYPDLVRLGNRYFIELTDSRVPTLFFEDRNHQDTFFDKFRNLSEPRLLFTLLQADKTALFYDRLYFDIDRTESVSSEKTSDVPELQVFLDRLIRFRLSQRRIIDIHQGTKTELSTSALPNAYFEALTRDVEYNYFFFYKNFFAKRQAPPLALPLSEVFEDGSYFKTDLAASRKKLRDLYEFDGIQETLFMKLWKLSDQPVFSEYLRKGGWFELRSNSEDGDDEWDADGTPQANFHFRYAPADEVRKWWGELIQLSRSQAGSELANITLSLLADMTQTVKGLKTAVASEADESKSQYEWATLNLHYADNLPYVEKGYYQNIRSFIQGIRDTALKNFITERVLVFPDNERPEHEKTLHLLAEQFCKCPLKNEAQDTVDTADTWNRMLNFFIKFGDGRTLTDLIPVFKEKFFVDFDYDSAGRTCVYRYLTNTAKLQLRLLLPPDTRLVAGASNILDNANSVLDANFILS